MVMMLKNISIIALPILIGFLSCLYLFTSNDLYLFIGTCFIGFFLAALFIGSLIVYIQTDRFVELETDADMLMLTISMFSLLIYIYAVFSKIFLN